MMLQLKKNVPEGLFIWRQVVPGKGHSPGQVNFSMPLYEKHGNPYAQAKSACPYSD